jgi:hypothetical protein
MTCIRVTEPAPFGAGGPSELFNACFRVCRDDSECAAGLCRRNQYGVSVCAAPACASDADCTVDPCGRCFPEVLTYHGGQILLDFSRSSCVYQGECRPEVCPNCVPAWEHNQPNGPNGYLTQFHACPGDGG